MSEFSKFIAAADAGERPLETDLYTADPQGLEADNIAATGNLNIGAIIDYDAKSEHRQNGGATPVTSFQSDEAAPASDASILVPASAMETTYTTVPAAPGEPVETHTFEAPAEKSVSYQQPNHASSVNTAAEAPPEHRNNSSQSVSNTHDPSGPTVINEGGGDTYVNTTYNYIDNSVVNINNTFYDNDINIGLPGLPLPPIDNIPTIIENVFTEITGGVTNIDNILGDVLNNLPGLPGGDGNIIEQVVNTIGGVTDGLPGLPGLPGIPGLPGLPGDGGDLLNQVVSTVNDVAGNIPGGGDILNNVIDTTQNLPDTLTGLGNSIPGTLVDAQGFLGGLTTNLTNIANDPTTALDQLPGLAGGTINGLGGITMGLTDNLPGPVSDAVDNVFTTTSGVLADPMSALDTATMLLNDVSGGLPAPLSGVTDNVLATANGLVSDPAALLSDPTAAVNGVLDTVTGGGTVIGATDGVLQGAIDNAPAGIAEPVTTVSDTLATLVGGFNADQGGLLGTLDGAVHDNSANIPAELSPILGDTDSSLLHNVIGGFGDADSGALSTTTTPILSDVGDALGGTGALDLGGIGDAGTVIENATTLFDGLAGSTPLGGSASPFSSEGSGSVFDGAALPGALAIAEPLVGLANDLGLSESNIAPMQDISMPLDSVMSILSGGDTSTSSLMQAANLPIADATDNAATLLALTDMPSTLSDALSDAGNLLGGGDVLNATAASTADAAAASLPAPVITAPVSQLLSGLFHH